MPATKTKELKKDESVKFIVADDVKSQSVIEDEAKPVEKTQPVKK